MKLGEICRKFETEEEKVLPFYASSLTKEEQNDVNAAVLEAPNEALVGVSTVYMNRASLCQLILNQMLWMSRSLFLKIIHRLYMSIQLIGQGDGF